MNRREYKGKKIRTQKINRRGEKEDNDQDQVRIIKQTRDRREEKEDYV